MSTQARSPPELAAAPPYAECAPDNRARLVEDALYDAILATYRQSLGSSKDAWGARCLLKIMHEIPPGATQLQEIARNCMLLILALFSRDGNDTGMPGKDIHHLQMNEQVDVLNTLKDLLLSSS